MTSSPNDQDPQLSISDLPKPRRMSWLIYFGIAFIIAIWTALGALFFLAFVWVLRMNPNSDISFTLGRNDPKTARRVYTWLFLSPFITVPIFLSAAANTYSYSTNNERVLAALVPLIFHIPLLLGLTSKSVFVYRHTQQGILLIALRAGMASLAALNVEDHIDYALVLFFLGNGSLWLISSIVGWSQISNSKCWFMDTKGEKVLLPGAVIQSAQPNATVTDQNLNDMLKSLDAPGVTTARQKAIHAFRSGTPELKKRAVAVLAQLGEVEKF